jgi:hypothetical protein
LMPACVERAAADRESDAVENVGAIGRNGLPRLGNDRSAIESAGAGRRNRLS